MQTVADAMAEEPALEAVRVDRGAHSISVATLGRPRSSDFTGELSSRLERLQADSSKGCALLSGEADCGSCPAGQPTAGGRGLTVEHASGVTTISRITCPTAPKFWRWRDIPWPRLVPRKIDIPGDETHENEWKWQLMAAGLCAAAGLTASLLDSTPWAVPLFLVSYAFGGWFAVQEVWEGLRRRILDVHFLMLAVAAGSASIGAWGEGAILLFLFALSGGLEHFAMGRTQREIRSLFKQAPKMAIVVDERGRETPVPTEEVRPGMRLMIKPGELFPVDAEIAHGTTAADESNLTGEAEAVEKRIGDTVLAGTLNLWGAVEVSVLRPPGQSALEKIVKLIKEAQHLKAPSQRFTDRFGTRYTYGVLVLSAVMFLWWWLAAGLPPLVSEGEVRSAFYRTMTLLVVASPCALVLSIPSSILAAIASGAKRGVLFRGGAAVEMLSEVDTVAMDKTGTLTTGDLRVASVESFPPGMEASILHWAHSLEKLSTHPLARAIERHAKLQGSDSEPVAEFESVSGQGLAGVIQGVAVRLGKREWATSGWSFSSSNPEGARLEPGYSEVWVRHGEIAGRLILRDDLRPEAKPLIEELHSHGLATLILTGDRESSARLLRDEIGIQEVRSGLNPAQKLEAIEELKRHGKRVAMIGDGVNDAPSLAAAHVGVAMGARGSDAALEQAEVVLMNDRLENFLLAWQLSHQAKRVIRQNLAISLGTVVVLVAGALGGLIPLTLGVVGHEGSTVIVVLNSLRLLFFRHRPTQSAS